jgi:CheY-like chemotaxis protein
VNDRHLALLLADADAGTRSVAAALASERVEALTVLEAADGEEAIRVGIRRRPHIGLVDTGLPGLGGVDAVLTLRALQPQVRVALWSGEPRPGHEQARELQVPVFDKLDLDRILGWLERQAEACRPRRRSFACSSCGYGAARSTPPARCPMCQRVGTWIDEPRRRFTREPQLSP